jgi:transcriptional regulator GlxA family with amidase domain
MHVVAIAAFDGVVAFDLATPIEVFGRLRLPGGRAPYRVRVCGAATAIDAGPFTLRARHDLAALARADTVIVPGIADLARPVPRPLVAAIRAAAARGARVASICSGAFVLAATGLLDGRRATTHWLAAAELARRHPAIDVDPGVLYVDSGQILTSAGAAAGLDLCLHLIRRDLGAAIAADAARLSVMPLERAGGQAQFIAHAPPPADGASLAPLLDWLDEHAHRDLPLRAIARKAGMSTRSLSRHFRAQTGVTPAQWLLTRRVRRAQQLLETTACSIERIAELAGFGSTPALRAHFQRIVGNSPQGYRRAFVTGGTRRAAPRRTRAPSPA